MSISKEERDQLRAQAQQAKTERMRWITADRDAVLGVLEALDEQGGHIAELQAEADRLHALYYGEREAHNGRGGA